MHRKKLPSIKEVTVLTVNADTGGRLERPAAVFYHTTPSIRLGTRQGLFRRGDPFRSGVEGLEHRGCVQAALTTRPGLAGQAWPGPQPWHLQPVRGREAGPGLPAPLAPSPAPKALSAPEHQEEMPDGAERAGGAQFADAPLMKRNKEINKPRECL